MPIAVRVALFVILLAVVGSAVNLAFAVTAEQLPLAREVGRGRIPTRGVRAQVPQIPATFYGSATVDGQAPPEGSSVRGIVNGLDCTQPGAAGTITAEGVGAYVIHVMHETQMPGCGNQGATVSFTIAGRAAGQSAPWAQGPQMLGLNAGTGEVQPLPSTVPVSTQPGRTASAVPSGAPPTGDIQLPGAKPTPLPPGTSDEDDNADGGGLGIAGLAIIALFMIALLAGAAGVIVSRRNPTGGLDS